MPGKLCVIRYHYPPDAFSVDQWFSTEPIPEIQGYENPDDPELLGESEHLGGS